MVDNKIVDQLDTMLVTSLKHLIPVFHCPIGFMQSSIGHEKGNTSAIQRLSQNMNGGHVLVIADIVSLQRITSVRVNQRSDLLLGTETRSTYHIMLRTLVDRTQPDDIHAQISENRDL